MNSILLKETILYGNLELIYSGRVIKKINFNDLHNLLKNFTVDEQSIFRLQNNIKYIINCNELDIFRNNDKAEIILSIFDLLIQKTNINTNNITIDNTIEINVCYLVDYFYQKIAQYVKLYENVGKLINKVYIKYKTIIDFSETNNIVFDYIKPLEETAWSPTWKLFFKNQSKILKHVDIFLDNIFVYNNITFNIDMFDMIKIINQRLTFLKSNTVEYYPLYVKDYIEILTNRIYNNFPLQIIYNDYLNLLKNHTEIFKPEALTYLKLEHINENNWTLIILPNYIIAYLLGYHVISSDAPTIKNMIDRIKNFDPETYFKYIAEEINQKLIILSSHGIDCGNGVDENGFITDVLYERVIDYNYDDIFMLFDSGTYFVFTCSEYESLRANAKNSYNSTPLSVLHPIIFNQKFKSEKIISYLSKRNLEVKFNHTMYNNFNELKESLKKEIKEKPIDNVYNSFLNIPYFRLYTLNNF